MLVGQRTAGAVASSELLPLPDGGGLQVAVAAATAAESGAELDGVGITPDVFTSQSRSLADYRSGRDPQLDAAVAALANAPAPPAVNVTPPRAERGRRSTRCSVRRLPPSSDVPTERSADQTTNRWQRLDYLHPNELIDQNGGAPDPVALQQTMRARGYQGVGRMRPTASTPGDLPASRSTSTCTLQPTARTARSATNDIPCLLQPMDVPVQAGDETRRLQGRVAGHRLEPGRRGAAAGWC